MKKFKLALLGNGRLNEIVAKAYADGLLPEYELVGVFGRTFERTQDFAARYHTKACASIEELLALEPDYVAEAASVKALQDYSELILSSGASLITLSIGAFVDETYLNHLASVAREHGTRIYIASGAVGGFDVLRTTSLMSPVKVEMGGKKSPLVVARTPLRFDGVENVSEDTEVFSGTTEEAIKILPTQVNVTIATALASAGPKDTSLSITAVPGYVGDEHHVHLMGEEVDIDMKFYSRTSAIAGWSVVAVLQNIVSPIVF